MNLKHCLPFREEKCVVERSLRCLLRLFENRGGGGDGRQGSSFLQVVKDYCCPNYELADALFNDPTYIARAGYE